MLVLTRKLNESIKIGNEVTITVLRVSNGSVRLGITAPAETTILRGEVQDAGKIRQDEPAGDKNQEQ